MSRSRSFRDVDGSVFFFFYMPRGSFFQNSAIFWHRDRGVKFSPRSEKRPEGENTHPSAQNCARRIWEDRGTDGTMGLLGAAPPCRPPRSPGCLHPRGARRDRTCSRTNFFAPVGMFVY